MRRWARERAATDTAISEATDRAIRPFMMARTLGGVQAAREGLEMERRICAVVLQRISGTS